MFAYVVWKFSPIEPNKIQIIQMTRIKDDMLRYEISTKKYLLTKLEFPSFEEIDYEKIYYTRVKIGNSYNYNKVNFIIQHSFLENGMIQIIIKMCLSLKIYTTIIKDTICLVLTNNNYYDNYNDNNNNIDFKIINTETKILKEHKIQNYIDYQKNNVILFLYSHNIH
jgi:hypothetical protein